MKEQSTSKGFAILSAAGIIVKVLSLIYIPFLLMIIDDEGYGIYAAAYQVYLFVYIITNSGIPIAISKLVSELIAFNNIKDAVRSFKIARFMLLVVGSLMTVLTIIFAQPLSNILNFEKSYWAIVALAPTLLFTSVASAYRGYFQGRGNMTPTAVSQVVEQFVNAIFTLVFAGLLFRFGLEAACAGGTIGTSLGALFAAIILVSFYQRSRNQNIPKIPIGTVTKRYTYKQLVQRILQYSIPITLCAGMQYAGNLIDLGNTKSRLLAANFSDQAANQMYSYLTKYQQLMNAPISIIVALAVAILPAISGAAALNNKVLVQSKINYAFRLCFMVSIPSAVGLAILSKPVYSILKFGNGYNLMMYGSIVLVLMSTVQIQATVLQGLGRLYQVTFNLLLGMVFKIIANYYFIAQPKINILGAIIGSILGFSVPIILNMLTMRKSLKININLLNSITKPTIASLAMGGLVYISYTAISALSNMILNGYLSSVIALVVSIALGAFTYLFCLVLLKGLKREDFTVFPSKFTRIIPRFIINKAR